MVDNGQNSAHKQIASQPTPTPLAPLASGGKLKIFLGAAPGVGKTYSMLDAAQARQREGVDVAVGYLSQRLQPEVLGLLNGLDVVPRRAIQHNGMTLTEMDLDAVLKRHPELVLIDELAHANAPDSRHSRRWQDVQELLRSGIDVYTTINVHHIESLRDIVYQITGLQVRETVPDVLIDRADEIELVDLSPDNILQRFQENKIQLSDESELVTRNFFRRGNLMALRELALRVTAERVDKQMQIYRTRAEVLTTWPAVDRILVCVSPGTLAGRLIRTAKRMAASLHAEWIVLYVELLDHSRPGSRDQVAQILRDAEQLGAETVTLQGHDISEEILAYARLRNVSKIVVGKSRQPGWRELIFGSVVTNLMRNSGDIDIYVISSPPGPARSLSLGLFPHTSNTWDYARAVLVVAVCTALSLLMFPLFAPTSLILFYMVGVVIVAARYGRGPSILASFLSVLAFDFFFVAPYLTFEVADRQYILTFVSMLLVAVIISSLTVRIRQQAQAAREREYRTSSLYAMSRELASSRGAEPLALVMARHISETFLCQATVFLPDSAGVLRPTATTPDASQMASPEQMALNWAYEHGAPAGHGTETLPGSTGLYLPMSNARNPIGVVGVFMDDAARILSPEQFHLLELFVNQAALAIERESFAEEAERARMQIETEQLRNSLLSSVSHDLRTPLAAITGAVSSLLEKERPLQPDVRRELAQLAYEEAERLNRLLGNLLEMTRLESGGVHLHKEWQPLEEVIGAVLNRMDRRLVTHAIHVDLPPDLPPVPLDSVLLEQVFVNLLDNAIKYTPAGSQIELSAHVNDGEITVEVADAGPGLAPGDEQRVFEKFYRARSNSAGGVGLGLTICRGIVEAHGGRIWAANRQKGGANFCFTLPLEGGLPPALGDNHA